MKRDPLEDGIRAMWEDTPEHLLAALDDHIQFVADELGKGVWSLLALKVMIETVASLQDRIAALEEQLAITKEKADRADARDRLYGPSGGLSSHETIAPPGSPGWGRMPPREDQVGPDTRDEDKTDRTLAAEGCPTNNEGVMSTTITDKTRTITLTDARPVRILDSAWPKIAQGQYRDHDNRYLSQANRTWAGNIRVLQHADGRMIVYGDYRHSTQFQDEKDIELKAGVVLDASGDVVTAIRKVGDTLRDGLEEAGYEHWGVHISKCVRDCIGDLPAQEL